MVARDTLGGAVGVAQQLPTDVGAALLAAAREAFTTGLRVTAGISAVVALGIAVLASVTLRDVPKTAQAEPAEPAAAAEPEPVTQPQERRQLVRTGGGCVACPGEHGKPSGELPQLRRPDSSSRGR